MKKQIVMSSLGCLVLMLVAATAATQLVEGVNDLGLLSYTQCPKTWTINLAGNEKLEIGVYTSARAEASRYGGWAAYLKINGEKIWEHTGSGATIHDYVMGQDVQETSYRNQYYDLSSKFHAGENTITYYHYTGDGQHGLKVKLTGAAPAKKSDGESCSQASDCSGNYCVHSKCRSSSTYCGDSYCDSGESCEADCGAPGLSEGGSTLDLGLLNYYDTPKTWTVNIDQFSKVGVGAYTENRAAVSRYAGWHAYLEINGERIWEHIGSGSTIRDSVMGQDVPEANYRNQYYDLSSKFHTGKNTVTYYHYTGDGKHGIKITVHGGTVALSAQPKADGESCSSDPDCSGGHCVHSKCRSSSTYCGDSYCDSGESCEADCGATGLGEGSSTLDLGLLNYYDTPKTWTVNIDQFSKVGVGAYTENRAAVSRYAGWHAYLEINGERIWEHIGSGSTIRDSVMGQDVPEANYRNQYYDLSSKFHTGKNTVTYYHYTGDGKHGIKITVHGGTVALAETSTLKADGASCSASSECNSANCLEGYCSVSTQSTQTATITGTHTTSSNYYVRVYNSDDYGAAYVGSTKVTEATYGADTGKVALKLQQGENPIKFTQRNDGGGYTWGFELYDGDTVIFDEKCGTSGVEGCNSNDQTKGTVYSQIVTLTLSAPSTTPPPTTPPTTPPSTTPRCGDGKCDANENCRTCGDDCGAAGCCKPDVAYTQVWKRDWELEDFKKSNDNEGVVPEGAIVAPEGLSGIWTPNVCCRGSVIEGDCCAANNCLAGYVCKSNKCMAEAPDFIKIIKFDGKEIQGALRDEEKNIIAKITRWIKEVDPVYGSRTVERDITLNIVSDKQSSPFWREAENLLQVPLDASDLDVAHELGHYVTYGIMFANSGAPNNVPIWFREGAAEHISAFVVGTKTDTRLEYFTGNLMDIGTRDEIDDAAKKVLATARTAQSSGDLSWDGYGASASFVEFLHKTYGKEAVILALADSSTGEDLINVIGQNTHKSFSTLEEEWLGFLQNEYGIYDTADRAAAEGRAKPAGGGLSNFARSIVSVVPVFGDSLGDLVANILGLFGL